MKFEIDTSKYSREEWLIGIFFCVFLYRGIITQFEFFDMLLTGLALLGVGWVFIYLFAELDKRKGIDIEEVHEEDGFDWKFVAQLMLVVIGLWIGYVLLFESLPYWVWLLQPFWFPYRDIIMFFVMLLGIVIVAYALQVLYRMLKPILVDEKDNSG